MVLYVIGIILMLVGAKMALHDVSENASIPEGAPFLVGMIFILLGYSFILSDIISNNIENQLIKENHVEIIFENVNK